jgi:hypothetical protein
MAGCLWTDHPLTKLDADKETRSETEAPCESRHGADARYHTAEGRTE